MSEQPTARTPRLGLPVALAVLALAAAIGAAYWTSFGGALVFDDGPAISGNTSIRHLWPPGAPLSPPPGTTLSGRPVANLSFALNYAVTGGAVWGYHAGNLLVHVLCALLLFGVIRRTLAMRWGDAGVGRDSLPIAFMAALLWGVHPLGTEAVTYVVQRTESLMALFVLLSLYAFIRAAGGARRAPWLAVSSVSCFLAAGSKEVGAVAPVLILLYDGLFVSGSLGAALKGKKAYYASLTAGWLLLAALGAASGWSRAGSAGFGQHVSAGTYWLTQAGALCRYLRLAVWPSPLVFDYGTTLASGVLKALPAILFIALLIGATAAALVRRMPLGYAGAWFFLLLAPTSLVPVATQTMAEHRVYLPLAAIVLCLVIAVYKLANGGRRAWIPLGILAFALTALTEGRNSVYGSDVSLWSATARDWPQNARAHCSLGQALARTPKGLTRAIVEYREAIRLHDNYADAHTDLGVALQQTPGGFDAAIGEFERAIQIRPDSAEARNDLGLDLGQAGRTVEARQELEEAIRIRPDYPDAECNLGILLLRTGNASDAQSHLERACRLDPANARAEFILAGLQAQAGKTAEATRLLRQVIGLKPQYAEAHSILGMVLFRSGTTGEGMAEIERAIALEPGLAQAHLFRAAALLQLGRIDEGRQEAERVLQIQPGNPTARQMLAAIKGSQ